MKCKRCGGTGREPNAASLGKQLRRARLQAGIGLREVARWIGCSPTYIVTLEKGMHAFMGPKAKRYARILGVKHG